jgi:tRNA (guanine-N7-)-methyltransferase
MDRLQEHKDPSVSRPVRSAQTGVHPRLAGLLERHLAEDWRAPLHGASVAAFEALQACLGGCSAGLVLDSGCGTGASTTQLARRFPDRLVIGVDKSADRLRRGGVQEFPRRAGNAVWLRAELATFWRLALRAGWRLDRHFLLYPNPWPKPGQLQRRWHAHPVFPAMLRLGGQLEMRCNWAVYAEEFAFAVNRVLGTQVRPDVLEAADALSPFERKYRASGHRLYSVSVCCAAGAV